MCLALPAQIIKLLDSQRAIASVGGIEKEISLVLLDDINEGDFVILHVGFALTKLNEEEAIKTLRLFDQMKELET